MEHFIYLVVLAVVVALSGYFWVSEHRAVNRARKEKDEIEVEERRMFDFLHGLGESLQEDSSRSNLHRYIVDGVVNVVDAGAGILYLLDSRRGHLIPVNQTATPAPVVPIPDELLAVQDPAEAERQLRGYVRLSSPSVEDSFIGRALQTGTLIFSDNIVDHPFFDGSPNRFQDGVSLLACPLIYGQRKLGVLAVTRKTGKAFSQNDREVFESVVEQSSFALGSAIIHSDADEKRQLERELRQASAIQKVLLPRESPQLSDYNLAASYRPARIVSGDYFDYVKVDNDHYGVAIGDVSGKGIAASLIAAMCRSLLRSNVEGNSSPSSVLRSVNQTIFSDIREDMFVSLLYLILERESNSIILARAGHEPPLLFRKETGEIESIEPPGMAAGVDRGGVFNRTVKDYRFTMEKGDMLILYTDGLIEAENRSGEEFGVSGLTQAIAESADEKPEDVVKVIEQKIAQFSGGIPQTDDIT